MKKLLRLIIPVVILAIAGGAFMMNKMTVRADDPHSVVATDYGPDPDGNQNDLLFIISPDNYSFNDENAGKYDPDRNHVNFNLPAGGIVGVIGPNGAGKTTLMRIIVGQEKPDEGSLRIGETVQLGYVDQTRDALNDNNSVWQ